MDVEFEKLKQRTEAELGRPIDTEETQELKMLFYFGQGVKLKTQLESEPARLGDVAKEVLADIKGRMERQHQSRVVSAVGDYLKKRTR